MTRTFMCFLLIIVARSITAQSTVNYSAIFMHKDIEQKTIIAGVTVLMDPIAEVRDSDVNGQVLFSAIPKGEYLLTIFSENHTTKNISIILTQDRLDTIYLDKLEIQLSTVEIRERREELFAIKRLQDVEGTSIYAGKKTEVVVLDLVIGNLAANNSRQVYAQIPGLNIYEGSDGGLQLAIGGRGLDPSRTANFNTRQNGYDISADVLGYPENYYTPPSEALSQIQILRGASSLQYGTQFGGLINFQLKEIPSFKKLEVQSNQTVGSFGFFNTFNRIGLNKGKFSLNSYANYKKGNGFRENSRFTSFNSHISLGYKVNDKIKLKAEATYFTYLAKQAGGLTDIQFGLDPTLSTRKRNWFDVDWKLYNLLYTHEVSNNTELTISLFHLNASRKSIGFRGDPRLLNDNPITTLDEQNADGEYILPRDLITDDFFNYGSEAKVVTRQELVGLRTVFLLGAKYFQSRNNSFQGAGSFGTDANFTPFSQEVPDYPNQSSYTFPNLNFSLFSEQIYYLNQRLSLTPGIRYEYIKTSAMGAYNQLSFDLAGNVIDSQSITESRNFIRDFFLFGLGATYKLGKSYQLNANISQNYRSVTFSDIRVTSPSFIVDPNIQDESGFTADINLTGRFKKILSYDVGLFSIYYKDRIGIILDNRANRVRKNIGTALIGGLESLVDLNVGQLAFPEKANRKLNVFINSAFTVSRYLDSQEQNVIGNRVEFIPLSNVKAGLSAGLKNVFLSFQYSYLSAQFTDVQNSTADGVGESRIGTIGEIPSYAVMDLTFTYNVSAIKVSCGINNLANNSYYTRRATGYPGPGIIPSEPRSYFISLTYEY